MGFLTNKKHSIFAATLCVLIAVTVLFSCGCGKTTTTTEVTTDTAQTATDTDVSTETTSAETAVTEIGTGAHSFNLEVTTIDNETSKFLIKTDKTTVGDALLEANLVSGTESEYGLMITTVNGVTADYNVDGTYWAFYIDGEYAMTGVSSTDITDGATYALRVSK